MQIYKLILLYNKLTPQPISLSQTYLVLTYYILNYLTLSFKSSKNIEKQIPLALQKTNILASYTYNFLLLSAQTQLQHLYPFKPRYNALLLNFTRTYRHTTTIFKRNCYCTSYAELLSFKLPIILLELLPTTRTFQYLFVII